MRRSSVVALLATVSFAGCGRKDAPLRSTASISDGGVPPVVETTAIDAGAPVTTPTTLAWLEAVRLGRYAEAAEGMATLSPAEQSKPEIRLARAKVLLATGKPGDALALLEKLDDELPLLRDVVTKLRADALFEVGPFDRAAEQLAGRRDVQSWLRAAEAWEKAGDTAKARTAWDRVIGASKKSRAQEERARSKRMAITRLKDGDAAAAADARWLAINALDDKVFSEAADVLEKLKPAKLLNADELMTRARLLGDSQRTDEAVRFVERAGTRTTAQGKSLPPIDLCHAKAEILWKARTRYQDAAAVYRQCANMGGPRAVEDTYLSARALSRAEHDPEAIVVFQNLLQKKPKGTWTEQSEYQIARIHAFAGRWKDAAFAFDEYAKHWPNGKEKREAARYRALAHLVIHDDKQARKLLEELAGSAEDANSAARWTNLAAVAALRDGDKLHALARWADVVRTRPLSYAALVARARIKENGGTLPPAIDPAESGAIDPLVVELPPPTDLLHRIGFDGDSEAMLREREAAIMAKAQTRGTEALCEAYAMLDRGKRRFQVAAQLSQQLFLTAPGPKNRSAWECFFPRPFATSVRTSASDAKIPPELVWSVMRQESSFDPEVVSVARAVGLMQLLPETARATAKTASIPHSDEQLTIPAQNIRLGALYLREMLDKLGDSVPLAVAAYNAGPEAIERWLTHSKGVSLDVFVEAIPYLETREYVVRVLGNLARYGYLDRGEAGVPELALELK